MDLAGIDIFQVRDKEPIKSGDGKRYFHFGATLSIDMSRDLLDAIIAATEGQSYSGYEDVLIDGAEEYGTMQWVSACTLKSIGRHEAVERQKINRAVWDYINTLDDDDPVGLYWSL